MTTPQNLDLHTLECFDLLMRERSVSRAAERVGLSQSSMSEVLARLRERFGDPLLVRTRDGMVPTERALALLPPARLAIDQLRSLLDRGFGFDPQRAAERFRITATDYAQLLLMPALTRRLAAEAPGCAVDLVTVNLRQVELALEAGDVDLAIAYYPEPPPGLRRGPLFADHYVGIARHGHPALGRPLAAAEFAALPHISVSPSGLSYFANVVDSALEAAGLARRIVVTCSHFLLASHLVSQSDTVLALPARAAAALTAFFPLQTVEIALPMKTVDVSMYWHERSHHARSHQWLRHLVRSILAPERQAGAAQGAAAAESNQFRAS
jgi:DNA-binding transcriptional LysR family regulator